MDKPVRIFIVDDNEIDLMIGKRLISRVDSNCVVETFLSGKLLYEWLDNLDTEISNEKWVFLIDIYMPNCSGFDVVKNLVLKMKNVPNEAIYYLLSATIDRADVERIKRDPTVKKFIGKPITVELIKNTLSINK